MNARFTVAQATPINPPAAVRTVKITQPAAGQSVVIELGYTEQYKLDLSAIADKKITLVHVGEKLIILFDNQSTVEVHPYFDSMGVPRADVSIEVSPGRDVSGTEFATLFPITDDQSVLPAAGAGAAGSPASGASFSNASVDPLGTPNPLPLLGPEDLPNFVIPQESAPVITENSVPTPRSGAKLVFFVEEEELNQQIIE